MMTIATNAIQYKTSLQGKNSFVWSFHYTYINFGGNHFTTYVSQSITLYTALHVTKQLRWYCRSSSWQHMLLPKLYNCRWTASTEQTTPVNFTCGKRIQAVEFTHSLWYVCKWNTHISTGGQEEETQHRPAGKGEYYRASTSGGFRPLCLKLNTLYLRGRPRRKDLKPGLVLS